MNKEKELPEIVRDKNQKFLMTSEKAARLKRNLRKITWSDEQFSEWQKTRKKLFRWN